MKKNMINKFTLKVLSLIIAILIWLLVRNVDDPIVVRTFYEIPVSIENASYLAENLEIPFFCATSTSFSYVLLRLKGYTNPGQAAPLQQMHVGDRWVIYIPSELGYGSRTSGPIPACSTLIFEIELLNVF